MSTNPWAQYAVGGPKTPPTSVPTETQPSNSWSQYAVGTAPSESSSTPTDTTSTPKNAWSQYAIGGDKTPEAETSNLPNPAPPQAQNQSLLDKAWHFVNTPLAEDFGAPSDIKGGPGFLGGVERGAYKVAIGLTSPLSLALTIGTLGTGGFLESAGGTVLKEALMAGDEGLDAAGATAKVEQFAKAAKAAKEAMTTGAQPVSRAVEATGMDYNEFRSLNSMLHEAGLNSDNLMNAGDALKDNLMATKGLDEETAAREAAQIQQKEAQAKGVLNGYFEQQGLDPAAAQTKIAQFQKAADAAKEAIASQSTPVSAAVKAASGMSYDEFTSLGNVLRDQGLTENDVIGDNITRRLTSKLFNKMGATPAQAQRIAKGSEFLMNAGFTGQQLSSAFHTIPQFEQALKEGDYKAAGEYLVEGIVNGGLGLIGATHALHSAGEAVGNWHPDEGVKLRPSDESYKLKKLADEVDGQHQEAENKSKNWEREMYQAVGAKTGFFSGMIKTAADKLGYQKTLDKYLMALATGNDPELARQYGNALADAIGKPEMKIGAHETFLPQSSAISEPVKAPEGSNLENLDNTQLSHYGLDVDAQFPVLKKDESKWIAASKNKNIVQQFHRLGIPGFSIEAPYKFRVSEQGNIERSTGKIRISAAVENPEETLAHELGHDIYNRLSPAEKNSVTSYILKNDIESQMPDIEERAATFVSGVILGREDVPASLRKTILESDLSPERPEPIRETPEEEKSRLQHEEDEKAKRAINTKTWADVARRGGNLYESDDIGSLVKNSGDFPLVVKDTYGDRHVMPASVVAKLVDDPVANGYIDGIFMAKNHNAEISSGELQEQIAKYEGMLNANKFLGMDGAPSGPEMKAKDRDYFQKEVNKLKEELTKRQKPDYKYAPEPVVDVSTLRLDQRTGAQPLLNFAKRGERIRNLLEESHHPEEPETSPIASAQHPGLPENIQEMVQHAKDNLSAEAKSHLERWMNAYHTVANGLDEGETAIFKKLRAMDDLTWNIGNAMGVLGDKIENHIHQLWERPDRGTANQLVQEGRTGNFETAVNTARRRVFQNYLEGLLAGYKIKGDNPIALIAHDYATVVKAAAHKNFLDSLRDQNVRGPDARPVVALDGEGHSIAGPNGENAAYLVNPNRVRNIKIADADVDRMRANGDLDRFLAKKDIIDITPKIRMDNIGSFIDQYEQMAEKQEPQYDEQGNNILRQKIAMLKDIQDHKVPADTLNEVNAQQKPVYVWHPQDYISPSHRAFKAWNWLMHTEDGKPILSYSDMKLHPEYAEYILNRLGLGYSALRDESTFIGKIGKAALRGGAEAKHVLLSLSPFHLNQLALRAVMLGVSPYYPDLKVEIESDPLLKLAVRNGLTLASDRFEMEQHTEGLASHSKLISKIPILGHAMDWYQDFLFNRVMQKYKAEAFKKMFAKYREAHPDWSDDGVAKAAADHVNAAFGGVPWKSLGRSTATQDWARLFLLAPDWLESEMRFAASMFHGGLGDRNFSREQVAKMAAGLWGIARILNYTTTGNFHFEAPFGLATKDKNGREIVYSVRTMPTDILHMASDPMGFLTGRLSPAVRLSGEALTHRDIYGRKLAPGQLAIDIARNMAPIPVEDLGQMMSGQSPEVGNFGQSAKAVGITAEVYRSPAEKLTMELASQRDESGTLNHAQVRHLEGLSRIENGLRSGTITYQQLEDARDFGPLTPDDYKKIRENLKLTHGLDPDMAAMVTKVNRMPAQDALQVWNVATPREKTALMHVMIKKKQSYIKKAFESETPQERMNDQTFLTFRQMFREPVNENQE